jgi:MoxR-like ATPase
MSVSINDVLGKLDSILLGKDKAVRMAFCCLLARGHLLIEDIPGVGKTTLAHALAKIFGLEFRRVQFTSDLLPADVLGNSIFDPASRQFAFHPGPIFTQMLLADEVNRATPKAQSALLEAMEEGQVTIDGNTHLLPVPFFVIATQNPQRQIGTYPLPESQLDRFLMRLELGFPGRRAEKEMLAGQDRRDIIRHLQPMVAPDQLLAWQESVRALHVSEPVRDYILDLLDKSRQMDGAGAGLSPRAGLALQRCAQAWAFAAARDMVVPEDVQAVAPNVIAHRLGTGAGVAEDSGLSLTEKIIRAVPVR